MDVRIIIKNQSTTKLGEHIQSNFSISTISSFKIIEGKHDANRRRDCRKKYCQFLREHAMKIVNFKKKENY